MELPTEMPKKPGDVSGQPPRKSAVSIKARPEWKEWLERVAKHCRDPVAQVIDKAVAEYAKANGFEDPPPPR
jgi:RecA-family ATPase